MSDTHISCTHNDYLQYPDVITAQGIRYGKTGWRWDGIQRSIELKGTTRYI